MLLGLFITSEAKFLRVLEQQSPAHFHFSALLVLGSSTLNPSVF